MLFFRLKTDRMRSKGFSLDDAGGAMGDGEDAEADDGDDADS